MVGQVGVKPADAVKDIQKYVIDTVSSEMFSPVPQRLKARLLPTTMQSPKTLPEKSSVFICDGAEDGESTSE